MKAILLGATVLSYLAIPAFAQAHTPDAATMVSGSTLDLERVEGLKGPRGTLFGQSSTGGATFNPAQS